MNSIQVDERAGHGWWPYVAPYGVFVFVLQQVGARLPDAVDPIVLALKPVIVLGLVAWFWSRGAYPEWRKPAVPMTVPGFIQDVAVGLVLTAVWVAPYLLFPGIKPDPGGEFDPAIAGEAWIPTLIGFRLVGYAVATPICEELFIRGFVQRIADVWETEHDFRDQPIARYTAKSLIVGTIVFTVGHVPWEWWVCVPWIVLSSLWFYHRRSLSALMVVHATTNATLLALAVYGGGWLTDVHGAPFSFWFFV